MNEDPKSRLSKYCQAHSLTFPKYSSTSIGPSHLPQFKGTGEFNNKIYTTTNTYQTKKEAEQAVAEIILNSLKSKEMPQDPKKCLLVIDLDNQNQYKKYIDALKNMPNARFIGVAGPAGALPDSVSNDSRFEFWRTQLISHDATDIELVFRVAEISQNLPKNIPIWVFSRDLALEALVQILKRKGFQANFHCDILKWLNK